MASEVQICNSALGFLGLQAIVSLSDNSKAARTCSLFYDDKRDFLLRAHDWSFASKSTNRSPESTTPAIKWAYQFTKPPDCLKLRYVGDDSGYEYPHAFEGNLILCDYNLIYIKYTKQVTDPNEMDASFRECLSLLLAQNMAKPLTGSDSDYKRAVEALEVALATGRFNDSSEDVQDQIEANDWEASRL